MSGNWPLDINGKPYSAATFAGRKYFQTYPDLLSDWLAASQDKFLGYSSDKFIPTLGSVVMTASRYRHWVPGMKLLCTGVQAADSASFVLRVTGYAPTTGSLAGQIVSTNNGAAPVGNWKLTARVSQFTYDDGYYAIVQDGGLDPDNSALGTANMFIKRAAIDAPTLADMPEIFNDFNSYINFSAASTTNVSYPVFYRKVGTATAGIYTDKAFPASRANTCGLACFRTYTASDVVTLWHNPGGFMHFWADAEFVARVYVPNLSDATNRYSAYVGLLTRNEAKGAGFSYTDNVNTGRWVLNYGPSTGPLTINSTIAVTTGWHTLRMSFSMLTGTLTWFIDGVSAGSSAGGLVTTGVDNLMSPSVIITRIAGTAVIRDFWVDYYFLRGKSDDRKL